MTVGYGERTTTAEGPALTVSFAAGEGQDAPLTWSQRYYLAELDAARPHGRGLTVPRLYPLRPGVGEDDVAEALRGLMERFESLRSRVVRARVAHQRVHAAGTLRVPVHDLPPDGAEAVLTGLAARPFDVVEEWPVRAAVVTEGGRPRFLAMVFSHVAVDGYALLPVSAHLVASCAAADPVARTAPHSSTPGLQPRQQAEAEASPAGQRAAERALRHAGDVMRRMPATPRTPPRAVTGERFRFLRRRSAALDLAVGAVAARTGQSPASVLAAAMMWVGAAETGAHHGFVQLVSANRLRPETVDAVLPYSQPVPCGVDLTGASFAEAVRRTATASLRAFRAGPCPPDHLAELHAAVQAERGVHLDITPTLNYRPRATTLPVRETDAAELARAAADARSEWVDSDLLWRSGHYLSVDADETGLRLVLQVDTAVHPPGRAEHRLADLEHLLCSEAAAGPDAYEPS
ncbi:condensation domain-containing protein [Streptomyces sp. NRRL WC-3549]|uniref:condensation domain-containing protein n=1 Tax=Streptomyces sp. NRRL WC-3549 TaxID=1463925 RepID=UPI00131AEDE8|nr:condensation domain-containing protein [Streptomyces sp. NRRL WC-3549]